MTKPTVFALEKNFRRRGGSPPVKNSPSVAHDAMLDADFEAVRFLQDVAMEVPYGPFAESGLKIQTFFRLRRIAFMDLFEDITEDVKERMVKGGNPGTPPAEVEIDALRKMPEYEEIRRQLSAATIKLAEGLSLDDRIERAASRSVAALDRMQRVRDPKLMGEGARAASDLLEHKLPKPSRAGGGNTTNVYNFPDKLAQIIGRAYVAAKIEPPAAIEIEAEVVDAEPIETPDSAE